MLASVYHSPMQNISLTSLLCVIQKIRNSEAFSISQFCFRQKHTQTPFATTHPCREGSQRPPRLHQVEHCQQVERGDPLRSALVRHQWVLGPVLGSPVQERQGHTALSSVIGHKGD